LLAVLERDPFYQPALARLAEIRWCCQARPADAVGLPEQALALYPLSEWTQRILMRLYLDMREPASAERVLAGAVHPVAARWIPLYIYRHDWRRAADAAY